MTTLEKMIAIWQAAPEEARAAALTALAGGDRNRPPRLLRRREVAARLAVCPRVIDNLARQGALRRVKLPGRMRGAGYVETEVDALLDARMEG